jgi:pyruvate ferredoxin oxidoreductase beta subunit
MWVLKECINGEERITYKPAQRKPVEEYLKLQKRFRHLFKPEPNTAELAKIQKMVKDNVDRIKAMEDMGL